MPTPTAALHQLRAIRRDLVELREQTIAARRIAAATGRSAPFQNALTRP